MRVSQLAGADAIGPLLRAGVAIHVFQPSMYHAKQVLLDDELISMTEGLQQIIPDVSPGPHRIQVEFVASDHAPFDPRVVSVVAFVVKP